MSRLARRLVAHCPPGPVLDMLAASLTALPAGLLTVAPSDEVSWKLYRALPAEQAATLVEVISSPALLTRIHAREKRVGVRLALAANPHIPPLVRDALFVEAVESSWDGKLLGELLHAAPARVRLDMLARERVTRLLSDWTLEVVNAISCLDDAERDEIVLAFAGRVLPQVLWSLAERIAYLDVDLPAGVLLDVLRGHRPPEGRTPFADRVLGHLLEHTLPEERASFVGRIAEALPFPEVLGVLVRLARDEDSLDLHWVLDQAAGERERTLLWSRITVSQVVLDDSLIERLRTESCDLPAEVHAQVRCSPAGHLRLAEGAAPEVRAAHLKALPDEVLGPLLTPGEPALAHLAFSSERLDALVQVGLDDRVLAACAQFALTASNSWRRTNFTSLVRERLVSTAPAEVVGALTLTPSEAAIVCARSELHGHTRLLAAALHRAPRLPREVLAPALQALACEPRRLCSWALSDGPSAPQAGDLDWLLTLPVGPVLAAELPVYLARHGGLDPILTDGLRLLPLPWAECSSEAVLAEIAAFLRAHLGENPSSWSSALTLLEEWTGTLPELIETLDALA